MQFFKRRAVRLLLLSLSGLLIVLCGTSRAADSKTLTVAIEPVYAPFEFKAADGSLQGFDVDIMRAIGEAAGFQVKFQSIAFDGMIPALQVGNVDAAVAAMTITPKRAEAISFSRPYFKAGLAIATPKGDPPIATVEELEGKTVAVQIGTTGAEAVKQVANVNVRTFNAAVLALQELSNGNVDAVLSDAPVMLYAIKTGNLKDVEINSELLSEELYGIPTPLNSPNLPLIDKGLTIILENGTYESLYRKWFNAQPPQLPSVAPGIAQSSQQTALSSRNVILNALPALIKGALVTLQLTILSGILGLIGGSLLGIARLSAMKPLRWLARAYIDFFRGTPLLVQIFMVYFGIPALVQALGFEFAFDRFLAAVIALTLNCAAYVAEIVRGGIQSIETGQTEAAQSMGMSAVQTMQFVVFPQAFRRMLPPLGNQFISLLKDTSLVAIIGFEELFREGQLIVAENYRPFELYAIVAVIYLVLTLLSSQAFSYLEKRMNPVQRSLKPQIQPSSDLA
ncbi:MAG: ABC transporter permease subunit [Timaviella obliquedivisa GSE-PSE-MK23-08B]|nr:ABC transporter permease subunit [Timaviella obliquedivisa GSE-PSE-MK23-08B]